ncbi:XRE family transcriptional regulator [Saccharothrix sp. NRRL B-16348]|uniref:helix-turn-helix transcriptional regulator n=1 Tax=Saccharothrix sp. NRRL B-16348 TaxID=1415542 RepID=UPI0006C5E23C|nr:helix-turn-helix transcriptional regulator [Saccharothrix sp. NRRL B-16348]KOX35168.1 XRE family transcriptional regulator [Saccharothrix sp. NRRL B-16348]
MVVVDRAELAAVLRTARSRVKPADVGLPAGPRRQVPGLRREEVAQLAGLGVDYVIRLEQGRGPKPSTQVLSALARALRLSDDDRDTLFRLADSAPPQAGRVPVLVRQSVLRLLDRMSDLPALVLSAKSDVLAWNPLATALLGDFSELPPERRNLIRQRFLGTGVGRVTLSPDSDSAADCVACLRTAQARYPRDPDLARLVADLRAGSARFDGLWRAGRSGRLRAGRTTIEHPDLGPLTLDCDVLLVPESDQTLLVYSAAPGTPSASALGLLRVTGLEQFSH